MSKFFIYIFLIISYFFFAGVLPSQAYDSEKIIRVGISDSAFSKYVFDEVSFNSEEKMEVVDIATGNSVKSFGQNLTVRMEDDLFDVFVGSKAVMKDLTGPVVITTKPTSLIGINGLKRAGKPAYYRGSIELIKSEKKSGFSVVNVLDLRSYLKGVVPNEMPVSFGLEALKSQCIAARNYALKPRVSAYKEFDICDSVACQVYFGAKTEKLLSDRAVEETDGLVALYEGDLILAVYSSTAGGYTESYSYAFTSPGSKVFPSEDVPYLQAKPDIPDMKPLNNEEEAREFYMTRPETFDNNSSYFRWTREWSLSEFIEMLNKTMREQAAFIKPNFTEYDEFQRLKEIKILKRGKSGKVVFLEIVTENGSYVVGKELVLRRLFKNKGKALPSANFVTDLEYGDNGEPIIKFYGGGFGHGVGMSQYGAGKMGQSGMSFTNILQHYYTNISIGTVPVTVENSVGKNSCSTTFFVPSDYAKIYIDENKGIYDFSVTVNGMEINLETGRLFKKKTEFDISEYVHSGINTVEIIIPQETYGSGKSLKYHIEVAGAKND